MFGKYNFKIRKAIRFATKVHEVDRKQKRKGKDIAYITHPLTVGIILSQVNAPSDVVVAGILHDVVEDSHDDSPITPKNIKEEFGENVMQLVESVTEENAELPWEERKKQALEHIPHMTNDQILLKSADVISNMTELIDDHAEDGDIVFERFNADKEKKIISQIRLIKKIIENWPENPLAKDLFFIARQLVKIGQLEKCPVDIAEFIKDIQK